MDITKVTILGVPLAELMDDPLFISIVREHQGASVDPSVWAAMRDRLCESCEVKRLGLRL